MSETAGTNGGRDPNASREWRRKIQSQQRLVAEANGVLRSMYKSAKSDGENVKELRAAIIATKLTPEEAVASMRDRVYYMALCNLPVTQEALFADLDLVVTERTQHEDDIWDAQDKGYKAGRLGQKIEECPYKAGTELFVAWDEHWRKGQASIAREMSDGATQADASRARPDRSAQGEMPEMPKSPRKAAPVKKAAAKKKAARRKTPNRRGANGGAHTAPEDGATVY
jgi:ribosome modulation factor